MDKEAVVHIQRAWQPTPVFLTGKSHRQRSLVGYSQWDHKEMDTLEATEHSLARIRRNSRKTTWFSRLRKMTPLPGGKAGECSRVTAGQKRPHLALCSPGSPVPSTPERREGLRACYWEGPSESWAACFCCDSPVCGHTH